MDVTALIHMQIYPDEYIWVLKHDTGNALVQKSKANVLLCTKNFLTTRVRTNEQFLCCITNYFCNFSCMNSLQPLVVQGQISMGGVGVGGSVLEK